MLHVLSHDFLSYSVVFVTLPFYQFLTVTLVSHTKYTCSVTDTYIDKTMIKIITTRHFEIICFDESEPDCDALEIFTMAQISYSTCSQQSLTFYYSYLRYCSRRPCLTSMRLFEPFPFSNRFALEDTHYVINMFRSWRKIIVWMKQM